LPQQTVLQQIDKSSTVAFTFMSKIILSAKSGSDWTDNELTAFNIQVDTVDSATFFNTVRLPAPNVSPVILTNEARPHGILPKGDRLFFHYMRDAVKGEESSVDDFAAFILGMFNYDEPDRVIHNRMELSFVMCGAVVDAKPDVCIMSESEYLLLVQEDKVFRSFFLSLVPCSMRPLARYQPHGSRATACCGGHRGLLSE
jgi:hypothetical protein